MLDLKYNYRIDNLLTYTAHDNFKDTECDVIMISGCEDHDFSSDAYIKYEYQWAMTASFLNLFEDDLSYYDLIVKMRNWLKYNKFTQIPQLSSGKYINVNDQTLLSEYNN
jgi:hypothetical protein